MLQSTIRAVTGPPISLFRPTRPTTWSTKPQLHFDSSRFQRPVPKKIWLNASLSIWVDVNSQQYFQTTLCWQEQRLEIQLAPPCTGAGVGVFVKRGDLPSPSNCDGHIVCSGVNWPNWGLRFLNPAPGEWYILVKGMEGTEPGLATLLTICGDLPQ